MNEQIRRVLVSRRFFIPLAVLLFYTIMGFLVVPLFIQWYVPKYTHDRFKCETTVGNVRLNPFLLRFEVRDFSMKDQDGSPLVGFARFCFDFEMSSLFQWAAIFEEFRLEKPMLNLVIEADGSLNFSHLAPKSAEQEPASQDPSKSKPVRLLFRNLELTGGDVTITDKRQDTPAVLNFRDLNLDLKSLSTHLDRNGTYLLFAKTQDGESIEWQGDIYLAPFRSRGKVLFNEIQAATLWKFIQNSVNLDSPSGKLSISTDYSIDTKEPPLQVAMENLKIDISQVGLKLRGTDQLFFELGKFEFDGALVDLASREVRANKLLVNGGKLDLQIDESGRSNFEMLVRSGPEKDKSQKTTTPKEHSVEDENPTEPSAPRQEPETAPGISPSTDSEPVWKISVDALEVKDVAFGLEDLSRVSPLSASVAGISFRTKANIEAGRKKPGLSAKEIATELKGVRLGAMGAPKPLFEAQKLSLEGGEVDLGARTLSIARIALSEGHLDVGIGEDGKDNIQKLFSPRAELAVQTKPKSGASSPPDSEPAWKVSVDDIDFKDVAFGLEDLSRVSPLSAAVAGISFRMKANIEAGQDKVSVSVREIATELKGLSLGAKGAKPFFESQKLSLEGGEVDLGTRTLSISRVALSDGRFDAGMGEDGKFDIEKLITPRPAAGGGSEPNASASKKPSWNFLLKTFELNNFRSRLWDYKALPKKDLYALRDIGVKVTEINGRSPMNFEVGLTAEQGGKIALSGKADPAAQSIDARINVAGLALSPIQPYLEPYITLTLQSAALSMQGASMDLKYRIQDSKLVGENQIIVDNLVLGERVESPDAVNLPLDLAVALLSDSNGRIDLGLPVSGDLSNPEFAVWPLVWKALVNVITKAVTAPFRAIGSLLGGDTENIEDIEFEPGKTVLLSPEKEKLKKVSDALQKKAQLKLVVRGRYSPEIDGMELKKLNVRRAVAVKMGRKLNPEEDFEPLALDDSGTRRVLEKMFVERFGRPALDELDRAVKEGKIQPRPVQDEAEQREKRAKKRGIFSRITHSVKFYKIVPGAKSPDQLQILAGELYIRLAEGRINRGESSRTTRGRSFVGGQ